MSQITEDDLSAMLANPFYAIVFANHIFSHKPSSAQEDWVVLNAHLIEDIGSKVWLKELLDVLTLKPDTYDGHDIINPSLAIAVSDRLHGEHEPLVTREQWIQANIKQIEELGANKWLWQLLDVLETGGPVAA